MREEAWGRAWLAALYRWLCVGNGLVGASLVAAWVGPLVLVYGHYFEPTGYGDMLPVAGVTWGLLLAAWWVHPLLFALLALLVLAGTVPYAHLAHFWGVGDLATRVATVLVSPPGEQHAFWRQYVIGSRTGQALLLYTGLSLALVFAWVRLGWRCRPRARWRWVLALGLAWVLWVRPEVVRLHPTHRWVDAYLEVQRAYGRFLERSDRVQQALARMPRLTCTAEYDKIVVVLGESANRDFMHLYGYPEPTTPFLDQLEPKVAWRAISPANQTLFSIPILLTPATVQDFEPYFDQPSIISLLRQCGYETFWLSNQAPLNRTTAAFFTIAQEADVMAFTTDHWSHPVYDETLLDLVPEDVQPGRKQAFFFHLLGSHFAWQDRYPPDQALFPQPRSLPEVYANTLWYTDRVLERIFTHFHSRAERMLFVYLPDHGELIVDDPAKSGHAFDDAFQEEYRIPFVVWTEDRAALEALREAGEDRIVNMECLYDVLTYLVGLETQLNVSYSPLVLRLSPGRIANYFDLPAWTYAETRP